jgi:hypothetical protein
MALLGIHAIDHIDGCNMLNVGAFSKLLAHLTSGTPFYSQG